MLIYNIGPIEDLSVDYIVYILPGDVEALTEAYPQIYQKTRKGKVYNDPVIYLNKIYGTIREFPPAEFIVIINAVTPTELKNQLKLLTKEIRQRALESSLAFFPQENVSITRAIEEVAVANKDIDFILCEDE